MEAIFGPGGRLEQVLAGYEPRAEQAAARLGGRGRARRRPAPARRGGDRHRQEPRLPDSRARLGAAGRRLDRDEGAPGAAADEGRAGRGGGARARGGGRRAEGPPELSLPERPARASSCSAGSSSPASEDAAGVRGDARRGSTTTETGDRAELEVEPSAAVWAEIAVGADRCLGRRCTFAGACFSEAARERASHAELVIANHALYFADLALRGRADGTGVLPEHDAVVFDEAHRLEESAATWLGGRISGPVLHRLLRDADRACREAAVPAPARALDRVEAAGRRLLAAVAPPAGRLRLREVPEEPVRALAERLAELAAALAGGARRGGRGREAGAPARRPTSPPASTPTTATVWSGPSPTRSRGRRSRSAPALDELLWSAGPTAVLVSATLTRGRRVRLRARAARPARRRRAGASARRTTSARRRSCTCRGTFPTRARTAPSTRVADEVAALCRISSGRALVLTSSYRALEAVAGGRPRAGAVRGARSGRGAAGAAARALPGGGRLGARRHLDLLAGDRRSRRVALAARDREAAVRRAGRPARRGALRAHR